MIDNLISSNGKSLNILNAVKYCKDSNIDPKNIMNLGKIFDL